MDFNSLDAQREACEAFIQSQRSEGWAASPKRYDDGGYSGGTLERPALQKLLEDIKAGLIQTIVVYKIDRLTRSLFDFAKLVEVLDQHNVSFVSITQSFNTTTSMGRLTLNVLLSFAQFEREVIGERVRDKISASKMKGMWMGGAAPAGYRIVGRQLEIDPGEAELVRDIFTKYCELGSVRLLKSDLDQRDIKSPKRVSKKGNDHGGRPFSRGNLYKILGNEVYLGKITHKGKVYDGMHPAIIDQTIWEKAQELLKENGMDKSKPSENINLLQGLLFDFEGRHYSPTYTTKAGRQYRYYLSQNLIQYKNHPKGLIARLPAHELEMSVGEAIRKHIPKMLGGEIMGSSEQSYILSQLKDVPNIDLVSMVKSVTMHVDRFVVVLEEIGFRNFVEQCFDIKTLKSSKNNLVVTESYQGRRVRDGALVLLSPSKKRDPLDLPPKNLKRLIQGIIWRDAHFSGESLTDIAKAENLSQAFIVQTVFKSFEQIKN